MLTPREAQAMQDAADARGAWLVWLVSDADPGHPGQVVARAHTLDPAGGAYLPGALIAGTLAELRALLPAGLTRRDPAQMPAAVVEVWD